MTKRETTGPKDSHEDEADATPAFYKVWFGLDAFTFDELVCLGAGVDPDLAPSYPPETGDPDEQLSPEELWPAPAVAACVQLSKFLRRSLEGGELKRLGYDSATKTFPRDVTLEFLAESEFCSDSFLSAYKDWAQGRSEIKQIKERSQRSAKNPERELSTRERETLLKMIFGMAKSKYRFDPTQTKSGTTKNIADDLGLSGVPLDEDTVRKWLKAAAEVADEAKD